MEESKSSASSRRGSLHLDTDPEGHRRKRAGSGILELAAGILGKHRKKSISHAEAECLEHIRNSEVLHEGWLTKCGGSVKSWKRRWFTLIQSYLCYAKDKNDNEILGAIPLALYGCEEAPELDKPHGFKMCSEVADKRTYLIYASSDEEKQIWMSNITKARKILNERRESGDTLGLPEPLLIDNSEVAGADTPDYAPPTPLFGASGETDGEGMPSDMPPIPDEGILPDKNINDMAPPPPPLCLNGPPLVDSDTEADTASGATGLTQKGSPNRPPPPPPSPSTR